MNSRPPRPRLEGAQRWLVGIVAGGAVVIAGIGFAGSYSAVRDLALAKGFGWFANVFPIGIDAGIGVLLALDLLLTWLRIPFPLLRQTAWLLTAATIAFNAATAWPDPLGVGMHAVIPVLFVVAVEAARHAIGRTADIVADRAMDTIRLSRWLLAPIPTFRLWRRMKLWELRSYDEVIRLEQDRLVYRARLRARYGRAWRRKAPVEAMLPLRLARHGIAIGDRLAAAVTPRQTICLGRDGVFRLSPPAPIRQSWAGAEPAGPTGQKVTDLASVLAGSHAPIVYFIRNGNRVKIGTSTNLAGRINSLSLRAANVMLAVHGSHEYEKQLHRRFDRYRVSGARNEWFELTGELAQFLAAETGASVGNDSANSGVSSTATGAGSVDSSTPTTGASTTASDPTTGAPVVDNASDRNTASEAARPAPIRRQRTARTGGKKTPPVPPLSRRVGGGCRAGFPRRVRAPAPPADRQRIRQRDQGRKARDRLRQHRQEHPRRDPRPCTPPRTRLTDAEPEPAAAAVGN